MPISAEDYFKREVIKTSRAAKLAIQEISDLPAKTVRAEMHAFNDKLHKSGYPITHMHLKKAINGGGSLRHSGTSKAAAAILASSELKKFAKKNVNTCFKTRLLFRSNRDLSRAFYEATLTGEISQEKKSIFVKGNLIDTFDFRWDWWPKDVSLAGAKLRVAGNAAFIAQEMKLLKKVKLKVEFAGYVK